MSTQLFYGFEEWRFPADALDGPTDAADADTPQADALRRLLVPADDDRPDLPTDGWRVLLATDLVALFAAGSLDTGLVVAWFEPGPDGRWLSRGVHTGARHLGVAPPSGTSRCLWWPSGPQRGATLEVLATDPHCAGGRPTGDRLLPPVVEEHDDRVLVAFAATRLRGAQTCPSHPPTPRTIELGRPLGDRVLLDGGWWPPRPPSDLLP